MQRSKKASYSITSSASICIEIVTSIPSPLALFMLMTSSNLVGCMTGRSAGFSPSRSPGAPYLFFLEPGARISSRKVQWLQGGAINSEGSIRL
jgi:hypothetical protein